MDSERRKLCEDLRFAIKDEADAVEYYGKVESQLIASDNPGVRALGVAVGMIKEDEAKHKNVLESWNAFYAERFNLLTSLQATLNQLGNRQKKVGE